MKLYNSLTNSLEEFKPLNPNKVTLYVCGITPYDTTHLGHGFTYIFFDALIKYLEFKEYKVIYTQNVTDINDRDKDILQRAKDLNMHWRELADYWTESFLKDMHLLNWTAPNYFLKASENIGSMIPLIQKLLDKNLAYQANGSIFLDISKFPDFGKLSKLSREEMIKVAKDFEEDLKNPDKKGPLDITLWKAETPNQETHIPSFESPFGAGRPGWHIECSGMSTSTLGEQIDIHGGGLDLIFPHHEVEIAQSEGATGKIPFVKYWLHTATVFYHGEKMSKSKGNLVMVSDLLKKYSANAIRWMMLSHSWNKPWEYKEEDLINAQKIIDNIEAKIHLTSELISEGQAINEFEKIMDNNLDTPKALQFLLNLLEQNSLAQLKKIYNILGFA